MIRSLYVFARDRIYHVLMALIAAAIYGFPSRRMTVIGITGTKGKSTAVELLAHILESAGKKVVVSSSVRNDASGATMPRCFALERLMARGLREGAAHAVIEVTSQGVLQGRHRFIRWSAAALTNLSPEHIEAHGGFEKYRAAKVAFFAYAAKNPRAVFFVNGGDASKAHFIRAARGRRIVEFGASDAPCPLPGAFNAYNVGAAIAIAREFGVSDSAARSGAASFAGVRGRMEYVRKEPFAAVVDYAVTPDSLKRVYEAALPEGGKMIGVFGCTGGGRDAWKRPVMGSVAGELCDMIVLTDDDSYDESTEKIMGEIEGGFSADPKWRIGENYWKIADRGEAIRKAVSLAAPGDAVVITGKGGDRWLRMARGKKIPWSDQAVVLAALAER